MRSSARGLLAASLSLVFALTGCATSPADDMTLGEPVVNALPEETTTATPTPSPTPTPTVTATPPKPPANAPAPCPLGPKQTEVETALAKLGTYGDMLIDGRQTSAECDGIKKFQKRMGISPVDGKATATTADVATRIAGTDTAACNAGAETIACVDLTRQTFYLMKGGAVVLGPTVTRTGMRGFATPAGTFKIGDRSTRHWSTPYKVWLPYWQNFYGGDGLHATTTYIHNKAIGSHGCVNLLGPDASAAYSLLTYGSKVRLYGRRPGT